MLVVAVVFVVGAVTGVAGALAARRWPHAVAPRLAPAAVGREVAAHPSVITVLEPASARSAVADFAARALRNYPTGD